MAKFKTGHVSNIGKGPPSKTYFQGYVAGIIYSDGFEWLFQKDNRSSPRLFKTRQAAEAFARKNRWDGKPAFTRAYVYVTHTKQNMPLIEDVKDTEVIFID